MTTPIDFDFRPASYWDPSDPESAVVGNIKGQLRREMVRDFLRGTAAPELGALEEQYLDDEVDDDFRQSLGRIHPQFLGGEFLPPYLPGEVEIARIVLQGSVLMDVYSFRARRRRDGRIHYRLVDEYRTGLTLPRKTSRQPLTFGALVDAMRGVEERDGLCGDFPAYIMEFNVENGADPETMVSFISMESIFYPQLGRWWEERAAEWLEGQREELADEAE